MQFMTTLAYQLSRSIPEMKAAVVKALEDDPLLLSYSLDPQAHGLIICPLNDAVLMLGSKNILKSRPRLVIVDGLDECGKPKDQRYLLEVLSAIAKNLSYPFYSLWPAGLSKPSAMPSTKKSYYLAMSQRLFSSQKSYQRLLRPASIPWMNFLRWFKTTHY
jgi:hypothetical protein